MTLGQWLRQRRKEKRLTQAALAALSGVSASYISTIERQQPHSVSGAKLRPEPTQSAFRRLSSVVEHSLHTR